jgi:hypothetical protein
MAQTVLKQRALPLPVVYVGNVMNHMCVCMFGFQRLMSSPDAVKVIGHGYEEQVNNAKVWLMNMATKYRGSYKYGKTIKLEVLPRLNIPKSNPWTMDRNMVDLSLLARSVKII